MNCSLLCSTIGLTQIELFIGIVVVLFLFMLGLHRIGMLLYSCWITVILFVLHTLVLLAYSYTIITIFSISD